MAEFWIANTIADLIQGDVREHLPLERIPLEGDVLGLGTTTSFDNGELTFLHEPGQNRTRIWKAMALDGGVRPLSSGDGSSHFPYVCYSSNLSGLGVVVDLAQLGPQEGRPLQQLVGEAITLLRQQGLLAESPIVGLRLQAHWQSLVITVASKLCLGQSRRNAALCVAKPEDGAAIYSRLPHYRLAPSDPGDPSDPIRYLGASLEWDCCGFWDFEPSLGRVTVPVADAHLHLHGCSLDLRHGGHLHHEHSGTRLGRIERLLLYPLQTLHSLAADLAVEAATWTGAELCFNVVNRGELDVNDVGVAVVIDNSYDSHRYLRIPWLQAGASESFCLPLALSPGPHRLQVLVDPERDVLERNPSNNSVELSACGTAAAASLACGAAKAVVSGADAAAGQIGRIDVGNMGSSSAVAKG
jgi:hypothetical protein